MTATLLTSQEVSAMLRITPKTLANWRVLKKGPPYVKLGDGRNARVLYVPKEVQTWLASQSHT